MKVAANPEKSVTHDDQTFYFCSQECVTKFRSDPQRYLYQQAAAAQIHKTACQSAADTAKEALAKILAHKAVALQTEARRVQLIAERRSIVDNGKLALAALDNQDQREAERLVQIDRRIAQRAAETENLKKCSRTSMPN